MQSVLVWICLVAQSLLLSAAAPTPPSGRGSPTFLIRSTKNNSDDWLFTPVLAGNKLYTLRKTPSDLRQAALDYCNEHLDSNPATRLPYFNSKDDMAVITALQSSGSYANFFPPAIGYTTGIIGMEETWDELATSIRYYDVTKTFQQIGAVRAGRVMCLTRCKGSVNPGYGGTQSDGHYMCRQGYSEMEVGTVSASAAQCRNGRWVVDDCNRCKTAAHAGFDYVLADGRYHCKQGYTLPHNVPSREPGYCADNVFHTPECGQRRAAEESQLFSLESHQSGKPKVHEECQLAPGAAGVSIQPNGVYTCAEGYVQPVVVARATCNAGFWNAACAPLTNYCPRVLPEGAGGVFAQPPSSYALHASVKLACHEPGFRGSVHCVVQNVDSGIWQGQCQPSHPLEQPRNSVESHYSQEEATDPLGLLYG